MTHTSDRRYREHRERWKQRGNVVCHLCGKGIDMTLKTPDPWSFELDHLTPYSRGGSSLPSNTMPAHRRCNQSKSNKKRAPVQDSRSMREW